MHRLILIALLLGCRDDSDGVTTQDYVEPQELFLPDLSDIDLNQAFAETLSRVADLQLSPAWSGNKEVLNLRFDGCPDLYVGAPAELEMDDANGISWSDFCVTGGGLGYAGYNYWNGNVNQNGSPDTDQGQTTNGSRSMAGQNVVTAGPELLYEFKGEASDAMTLVEANNYRRWTYTSTILGTMRGTRSVGEGEGFRADMYIYSAGGNRDIFEARGNVYWFDHRVEGRFDSAGMDLILTGEAGAGPDDCTLEPKGWIGLRDENAYWYDLVFMPKDASDSTGYLDDEHSVCDGCGTLYLRGLETENYGQICPDFNDLWLGDTVELPAAEDFILTIQQLDQH